MSIMLLTDSYKVSHWKQYPLGTEIVYSYLEARGGEYDKTLFFGLQCIIDQFLTEEITHAKVEYANNFWKSHFGSDNIFNYSGWMHIVNTHGGKLPLKINAVPEGSVVPTGNVLMTIENTDPVVPWLTNWVETLLMQVWYPTTVATQSYYMKKTILEYLEKTGDPSLIDFKLHDFGFRGSTSHESSAIGGLAHLINFKGTDTASALLLARESLYNEPMAGFSIPAAEHSTITSWGRDNEKDAYENMLDQYPTGLVAVVSDSYDIYNACEYIWGGVLKDKVMARNGTLVIRPDSGDPLVVLPKILNILGDKFGYITNNKGYKVLDPHVRVIQGDGIEPKTIKTILETLTMLGWSTDNIAFGSGGGLLQKLNRDTCKFAIKCSAIRVLGQWKDVYKDPVTDSGKMSKKGRLGLLRDALGGYLTIRSEDPKLLQTVFENGDVFNIQTFSEIRDLVK